MKLLALIYAVVTAAHAYTWDTMGMYVERDINWAHFEQDIQAALLMGYNRIFLGFFMYQASVGYDCYGACAQFATLDAGTRSNLINTVHAYGAELYLVAGGRTQYVENLIANDQGSEFGAAAAAYAKQWRYDGIELQTHLSGSVTIPSIYATNGSFAGYTQDFFTAANAGGFTRGQLQIGGSAQYFSPSFVQGTLSYTLSYLALTGNQDETWAVQKVNLIEFDEDSNYMDYQNIFVKNTYTDPYYGNYAAGSAVKEIRSLGMSASDIAITKPVSSDVSGIMNGYISPTTLGQWGCQAKADSSIKWTGGYSAWTWDTSDQQSMAQFASEVSGQC